MTCPHGKLQYVTPAEASKALRAMTKTDTHSRSARSFWSRGKAVAYRCKACGAWHVGHAAPKYSLNTTKRRRELLRADDGQWIPNV